MFASVIVDIQHSEVDRVFDYAIPPNLNVVLGSRVLVPFGKGNKKIEGFVINLKQETEFSIDLIKSIISVVDEYPVILPEMLQLMNFMVERYNLIKIDVLRLCLPSELRVGKVKKKFVTYVKIKDEKTFENFKKEAKKKDENKVKVLDYVSENGCVLRSLLNKTFPISAVNKLIENGLLETFDSQIKRTPSFLEKEDKKITLNASQEEAIKIINNSMGKVCLLYGVTGSGKTEVYMHCIEEVLKQGKTAIMLVPEISLTPQVLANFKARFGDEVAMLHSGLSAGEKFDEWEKILTEQAKIVVGARSAIFAPIKNLGLIVIDEEHDASYSSDSNPRYNTIEVASFRAKFNNCPVVLGSATPNVESYYKAKSGEYNLATLPVRANKKEMPTIYIVDKREANLQGENSISSFLASKLKKCIQDNNQAIIFLNRRGFVSFLRCQKCGYTPQCEDCDVSLVYHKEDNQLKCHFCDRRYHTITVCPICHARKFQTGSIGTQKLEDELRTMFPNVPLFRMDNDTTSTKNAHLNILSEFGKTCPSILIGTQMIAKGHDFPKVSLVGIVDADISLNQSDFRANERTFQIVTQVSGRAGRADVEGEVVLQTFKPDNFVYRCATSYDYETFYNSEIKLRKITNFPPFTDIVRILFSGEDKKETLQTLQNAFSDVSALKEEFLSSFAFCKAMVCPVGRMKTKYRYQILIKLKNEQDEIFKRLYSIVDKNRKKNVACFVEVNPQNLS